MTSRSGTQTSLLGERVTCRECGRAFVPLKNGVVRQHTDQRKPDTVMSRFAPICKGSKKLPAELEAPQREALK